MKVRTRLLLGYGAMIAILAVAGAVGLFGITLLQRSLSFLAGPAWETADGAMNGIIALQSQQLAVRAIREGTEVAANRSVILAAEATATEEFARLEKAGQVEGRTCAELRSARERAAASLDRMLEAHERYRLATEEFDTFTVGYVELGVLLEELGDSAVEELERAPGKSHSWSGGLRTKWAAADGGMEANIGLLQQLYHLSRLRAGLDPMSARSEIETARGFQREAQEEMLATGLFDRPITVGPFAGETHAAAYRRSTDTFFGLVDRVADTYLANAEANASYEAETESLVALAETIEERADAVVNAQLGRVGTTVWTARGALVIAMILGLALALVAVAWTLRSILLPIEKVRSRVEDIASGDGDLTQRVGIVRSDEVGDLARNFDDLLGYIHDTIVQVRSASDAVARDTEEVSVQREQIARSVEEQLAAVTTVSSAIEEMSSSVVEMSHHAAEAAASADDSGNLARTGGEVVRATIDGMQAIHAAVEGTAASIRELGARGREIGEIVSVINEIAEQTNLLALNAAIEAARAGEHGRGFAVVADEVRKLADRTTTATDEISRAINLIQTRTEEAVGRMEQGTSEVERGVERAGVAGQKLERIVVRAEEVAEMVKAIARTTEEQADAAQQVAEQVGRMAALTEENAAGTARTGEASQRLSENADLLRSAVARFRVAAPPEAA